MSLKDTVEKKPWVGWVLFLLTVGVVYLLGVFSSTIVERRTESSLVNKPKIKINNLEPRNEVWGINYPREYETYMETKSMDFRSKYNGSAMIDMLDEYPALVILWAGYKFSQDYNQARGHYYAVEDIRNTLRTGAPMNGKHSPMPNTCWTCKSPDVPRKMKEIGIAEFYSGHWEERGSDIINPIGCADCHDENTMKLKITRPALIEAFERQGKDITKATHQEMRTLVCAQCHVEYYFNSDKPKKGVPYLTFPWDNGTTAEEIEEYFDDINFKDYTHQLSKAPIIKAQHPGYETYTKSIHYQRGVSCADCHMPYKSEGGVKFTDHKIQSPLNNIANSCQVCHRESEEDILKSVYNNMDRVLHNRGKLEEILVKTHLEAEFAWKQGATEEQMKDVLLDIRHAQWRWDYAAAAHGAAFHAPVEILRVVGTGIEIAQEARMKIRSVLTELGYTKEIPIPDVSTKEKAQKYIGVDLPKLRAEKKLFLDTVVPKWLDEAEKRESKMPQYDQAVNAEPKSKEKEQTASMLNK
ncbi:ammonia-forming cytochrome c nitrite reductase [Sediminitomix flava]|uniref:nitrite reductase (cytochrome; ammonia-forming) n=1 Tax=Sediminitomix flava TaxID=379075 RepID=A0A315ZFN8_SEDFL|nr:ammonia-forming cytochrome c nitrite reductase [Sediminitomix flava]PWJ44321.1 respiratory nitrite reductase (cytochrome; ammonia-forming) precursor [Sediminitomix flava]